MLTLSDIRSRVSRSPFCPQGHDKRKVGVSKRKACIECRRQRAAAWSKANPEKTRASAAAWRARNPNHRTRLDPVKVSWHVYRNNAHKRSLQFALSRPHFEDLISDNCFYCGTPPATVNGVDRVDNARGYVEDNVVTACARCNSAKLDSTRTEFEDWLLRAGKHLGPYYAKA